MELWLILFQITFYKHSTRALGHEAETCLYSSENFLLLALQKVLYKGYATVSLSINYLLYKNYGVFFSFSTILLHQIRFVLANLKVGSLAWYNERVSETLK